jgi:hypothetical protein
MCLLHKILTDHFNVKSPPYFGETHLFHEQNPSIPLIGFTHAEAPFIHRKSEIKADKSKHRQRNVALMVRDPRDTIVSCYLKHTKQPSFWYGAVKQFTGSFSEYLRHDLHGIEGMIIWLNNWVEQRFVPKDFMLLRYEDMVDDTAIQLKRVLDFVGLNDATGLIDKAVRCCSFAKMQETEKLGMYKRFRVIDPDDPETWRVRQGKVGGYIDYMSAEDLRYANTMMQELNSFFGYSNV